MPAAQPPRRRRTRTGAAQRTFARRVLDFYRELEPPRLRGLGVKTMYPYGSQEILEYTRRFYEKFFNDRHDRVFILGINPGRFGAGTSGITFTDGVALEQYGVPNALPSRREMSAEFVQMVIARWGGPEAFYREFFISAVSPIGFTRDGLNYNYYDHPRLLSSVEPFIIDTMWRQIALGARRHVAIVLGTGRNFQYLRRLNEQQKFFESLVAVEHPRFIMQYRRRRVDEFVEKYVDILEHARHSPVR